MNCYGLSVIYQIITSESSIKIVIHSGAWLEEVFSKAVF